MNRTWFDKKATVVLSLEISYSIDSSVVPADWSHQFNADPIPLVSDKQIYWVFSTNFKWNVKFHLGKRSLAEESYNCGTADPRGLFILNLALCFVS